MTTQLPNWALETATPDDRSRVEQARHRDTLQIQWPDGKKIRGWAKQQGWPAPRFGFQDAFLRKMLENDETFALALQQSGIVMVIPVQRYTVSAEELQELDELYAARSADRRPTGWGILVEGLREIRRAVEAGVVVEIDGRTLESFGAFYNWAHGRYHMLEDGYDRWIGDDRM